MWLKVFHKITLHEGCLVDMGGGGRDSWATLAILCENPTLKRLLPILDSNVEPQFILAL